MRDVAELFDSEQCKRDKVRYKILSALKLDSKNVTEEGDVDSDRVSEELYGL